ncbi:MAG: hypothetical protein WCR96_01145 [Candidatus Methanomethylophilaceae archaeon]
MKRIPDSLDNKFRGRNAKEALKNFRIIIQDRIYTVENRKM